jgi:hypothetical protein
MSKVSGFPAFFPTCLYFVPFTTRLTRISKGAIDFCQSWDEVMTARRKQRSVLNKIQEDLKTESFTGKEARKILL